MSSILKLDEFISWKIYKILCRLELKKIVLLTFALILFSTAVVVRFINPVVSYSTETKLPMEVDLPVHNIDSGKNFSTIQEAINDNETLNGHTILVDAGLYHECIVVNKSLSLIGEDRSTTIIDGDRSGTPVEILSNNVIVSGFTIRNSSTSFPHTNGIHILSNSCVISNNVITHNNYSGILIDGFYNNIIINNTITNNSKGIELFFGSPGNNTIRGNTIALNDWYGIYIVYSGGNKIYHNNFTDNRNQTYSTGSGNTWDNGYPSGGNYWSDYTDVDQYSGPYQNETGSDGIWDNPYFIDENNRDNYPLIHLYGSIRNLDTNLTYLTIQSAIDAPETLDGQTIRVDAGTYYEHVTINKSISLIGESKATTIIDGNGTTNTICIITDEVEVSGFTITNGGSSWLDSGIYLNGSASKIHDNLVASNSRIGIFLSFSNNNTLSDNTISNNAVGVYLNNSDFNEVRNNSVMNNENGIWLVYSSRNTFAYNNITGNSFNLGVDGGSLLHFVNDIDTSNKVNGKPVYYLINQSNIFLDNLAFSEIGYMGLVNCVNITLRGLDVTNNVHGVMLAYTCDSTIQSVKVSDNGIGIDLWSSNNNTIIDNTISNNSVGILLSQSSWNSIRASGILESGFEAIFLEKANRNNIVGNTISNGISAFIVDSNYTVFYHNNFINKTIPMSSLGSNLVILDNGAEGNYWSDYNGIDSNQDGIGDSPYSEPGVGSDLHPLMGIFSDFKATSEHHVQIICNSSISDFQFNGTAISFNVSGENDTPGFCRIRIPTAFMNGIYKVFVNGTEVSYALLPCSNTTHSYLYFTYNHSTHEVAVIPEFPAWTPMLLILILFTVAIALYKRRLPKTPIH